MTVLNLDSRFAQRSKPARLMAATNLVLTRFVARSEETILRELLETFGQTSDVASHVGIENSWPDPAHLREFREQHPWTAISLIMRDDMTPTPFGEKGAEREPRAIAIKISTQYREVIEGVVFECSTTSAALSQNGKQLTKHKKAALENLEDPSTRRKRIAEKDIEADWLESYRIVISHLAPELIVRTPLSAPKFYIVGRTRC